MEIQGSRESILVVFIDWDFFFTCESWRRLTPEQHSLLLTFLMNFLCFRPSTVFLFLSMVCTFRSTRSRQCDKKHKDTPRVIPSRRSTLKRKGCFSETRSVGSTTKWKMNERIAIHLAGQNGFVKNLNFSNTLCEQRFEVEPRNGLVWISSCQANIKHSAQCLADIIDTSTGSISNNLSFLTWHDNRFRWLQALRPLSLLLRFAEIITVGLLGRRGQVVVQFQSLPHQIIRHDDWLSPQCSK